MYDEEQAQGGESQIDGPKDEDHKGEKGGGYATPVKVKGKGKGCRLGDMVEKDQDRNGDESLR